MCMNIAGFMLQTYQLCILLLHIPCFAEFLTLKITHQDIQGYHTISLSKQCCRCRRCFEHVHGMNTPRYIQSSSNQRDTHSCHCQEVASHHGDTVDDTRDPSSHRNSHIPVSPVTRCSSHDYYSLVYQHSRQSHSLAPSSRRHSYIPLLHCHTHLTHIEINVRRQRYATLPLGT